MLGMPQGGNGWWSALAELSATLAQARKPVNVVISRQKQPPKTPLDAGLNHSGAEVEMGQACGCYRGGRERSPSITCHTIACGAVG